MNNAKNIDIIYQKMRKNLYEGKVLTAKEVNLILDVIFCCSTIIKTQETMIHNKINIKEWI